MGRLLRGGGEVEGLDGEALVFGLDGGRAWRWRRRRLLNLRLREWTGARRREERRLLSRWRAGIKYAYLQWGENGLLYEH